MPLSALRRLMQHPLTGTTGRWCPLFSLSSRPQHGTVVTRYTNYTTVWNALDYPASTFPVTLVDPSIDVKQPRESFIDAFDRAIHEMYDPEVFQDLPICLQLVGRTLEEEVVIAMTEIVDAALKASG
ncbi:hypothetical protein JVU11DRAFT_5188 [Chiua virens]|nr:hypothetical protein JVU11DRAFT_5188 [Chiua virens]